MLVMMLVKMNPPSVKADYGPDLAWTSYTQFSNGMILGSHKLEGRQDADSIGRKR